MSRRPLGRTEGEGGVGRTLPTPFFVVLLEK